MFFCVHCDPNRDVPSDEIDLNNPMIIKIYTLYDKKYCGRKIYFKHTKCGRILLSDRGK